MRRVQLIFFSAVYFLAVSGAFAQSVSSDCLNRVTSLEKRKEAVASQGGIWGLFEKYSATAGNSSKAIQLDSNINKIITSLNYLCETQNGVPFNELARYVNKSLAEKGEAGFKKDHLLFGKSASEIDQWLVYAKFAKAKQKRTLEQKKINSSIQKGGVLVEKYRALSESMQKDATSNPMLDEIIHLNEEIEDYLKTDPYVALSVQERAEVPYWDIDENHGGS